MDYQYLPPILSTLVDEHKRRRRARVGNILFGDVVFLCESAINSFASQSLNGIITFDTQLISQINGFLSIGANTSLNCESNFNTICNLNMAGQVIYDCLVDIITSPKLNIVNNGASLYVICDFSSSPKLTINTITNFDIHSSLDVIPKLSVGPSINFDLASDLKSNPNLSIGAGSKFDIQSVLNSGGNVSFNGQVSLQILSDLIVNLTQFISGTNDIVEFILYIERTKDVDLYIDRIKEFTLER